MMFKIVLFVWVMAVLDLAHQIYAQDLKHAAFACVLVFILSIAGVVYMED